MAPTTSRGGIIVKKWLIDNFLPRWAKETVLADNRRLKRKVEKLEQEVRFWKGLCRRG